MGCTWTECWTRCTGGTVVIPRQQVQWCSWTQSIHGIYTNTHNWCISIESILRTKFVQMAKCVIHTYIIIYDMRTQIIFIVHLKDTKPHPLGVSFSRIYLLQDFLVHSITPSDVTAIYLPVKVEKPKPIHRVVGPLPKWLAFSWLINGGDPNYLLNGMILQVSAPLKTTPTRN